METLVGAAQAEGSNAVVNGSGKGKNTLSNSGTWNEEDEDVLLRRILICGRQFAEDAQVIDISQGRCATPYLQAVLPISS